MKQISILIVISLALGAPWAAAASALRLDGPQLVRHGITLASIPYRSEIKADIPILSPRAGLARIGAALDMLMEKSAFAADALNTLKNNGPVVILYDPAFPTKTVGSFTVAAFMPSYFKRPGENGRKGDFVTVIGRYGIKWSAQELAGVIGHELIGHGLQFLQGRRGSMRELERECEARLYQERINQDVRLDKMSHTTIRLRQNMENKYCAGFKRFMRRKSPALDRLWDNINPDVPRLLKLFKEYLAKQKTK